MNEKFDNEKIINNQIFIFINKLSKSANINNPSIKFDSPINKNAQYSQSIQQIQYFDSPNIIYKLIENESIAPLKWTLHEFAHHLLFEKDYEQNEEFAIWFADKYSEKLKNEWNEIILEQNNINVDINLNKIYNKISQLNIKNK